MRNRKAINDISKENQSQSHKSVQNWLEHAYQQNALKLKKFQSQDFSKINSQNEEIDPNNCSKLQQSKRIITDQYQEQQSNPISNQIQDQDSIYKNSDQLSDFGDKNEQKSEVQYNNEKIKEKIHRKKMKQDQVIIEQNDNILSLEKNKVQEDLNKYIQIEKDIIQYLVKVHNKVEELTKQFQSFK
ncbi:unnamed protein product [Paramecium sonneborni]|uniref:Uncharacterized protein n=1 Tax=Paramecium sonneborni TaxID=65129 RepID=A0A8S1KNV3_9CILI|nr:unnamed protein product [Paramecium sonneborni]CAD8056135.1 unnamed protein product [Paramecium sonneborni]